MEDALGVVFLKLFELPNKRSTIGAVDSGNVDDDNSMLLSCNRLLIKRDAWIIACIGVISDRVCHHLFEKLELILSRVPSRIDAYGLSV